MTGRDGRLRSLYPPVTPLLATPLAVPAFLDLAAHGWEPTRLLRVATIQEKLAASLIAALSSALVLVLLRRRVGEGMAILLSLAYAFGTSVWSLSAQALWQHGTAQLLLVSALLAATMPSPALSGRALFLAGLAAGLLVGNRPPDVFLAVGLLGPLLFRERARSLAVLAGAAAGLGPVLVHNLAVYGHWGGGYGVFGLAQPHAFYHHPLTAGVLGLLASPAKGLFAFSPFLAAGLFLVSSRYRDGRFGALDAGLLAGCAGLVVFYARTDWRGGNCYGPRFLSDALPALLWLIAPAVARLVGAWRRIFAAAVVASVGIHAIGAFCYPGGDSDGRFFPGWLPRQEIPRAVWDPRNWPPLVELRAGLAPPNLLDGAASGGR